MTSTTNPISLPDTTIYPDSDGQPMADNTLQFQWIVRLKENLEALFADRADVFVAGDLLWYPVQFDPHTRRAPDAMVVFGRPKGYRGSYKQWLEDGIAPQVVFEVLSPSNTQREMHDKLKFYEQYGVQEYYEYHPELVRLRGWLRHGAALQPIRTLDGWVSPLLGIRFDLSGSDMVVYYPDGQPFILLSEARRLRDQAEARARQAEAQLARLAAQLRALGIDPEASAGE